MESGALTRTGITGLERATAIVNIDHHLGNTGYGTVNWFDEGAAACVELVADAIDRSASRGPARSRLTCTSVSVPIPAASGTRTSPRAASNSPAARARRRGSGARRPGGLRQLQPRTRAPDRRNAARHATRRRGPPRRPYADPGRPCPRWLVPRRDRKPHQPAVHGAGRPRRVHAAERRSGRDPVSLRSRAPSTCAPWRSALAAADT